MIDNQIANLNSRIERLKKQKAKTQMQQAIYFRREAQKILKDDFTPEMALGILFSMWEQLLKPKNRTGGTMELPFILLPFKTLQHLISPLRKMNSSKLTRIFARNFLQK